MDAPNTASDTGGRLDRLLGKVEGKVSRSKQRVQGKLQRLSARLHSSSRAGGDGSLGAQSSGAQASVAKKQPVNALFVGRVTYTPSKVYRLSKRCLIIINGAELALVKVASSTFVGPTGAPEHDDRESSIVAMYPLNRLLNLTRKGNRLELEFAVVNKSSARCHPSFFGLYGTSLEELRDVMALGADEGGDPSHHQTQFEHLDSGHEGNNSGQFAGLAGPGSPAAAAGAPVCPSSCMRRGMEQGEYWHDADNFALTFESDELRDMAAAIIQSGCSTTSAAKAWLKKGFPLAAVFEISHLTAVESLDEDAETLLSGPTPWGLELELPGSWCRAMAQALATDDVAQQQPLMEVSGGPASIRVYMSTPAGLAVATLVPSLLARLRQQSLTSGTAEVLAVPVQLNLAKADAHMTANMAGSAPLPVLAQGSVQAGSRDLRAMKPQPSFVLRDTSALQALQTEGSVLHSEGSGSSSGAASSFTGVTGDSVAAAVHTANGQAASSHTQHGLFRQSPPPLPPMLESQPSTPELPGTSMLCTLSSNDSAELQQHSMGLRRRRHSDGNLAAAAHTLADTHGNPCVGDSTNSRGSGLGMTLPSGELQTTFAQEVFAVLQVRLVQGKPPYTACGRRTVSFKDKEQQQAKQQQQQQQQGLPATAEERSIKSPGTLAVEPATAGARTANSMRALACAALVLAAAALLLPASGAAAALLRLLLLGANAALLALAAFPRAARCAQQAQETVAEHVMSRLPTLVRIAAPKAPQLRLQLLGGAFARDPMGLLEEQIIVFRRMYERPPEAAEQQLVEAREQGEVVLISSPEPGWMTPDMRRRFLLARPELEVVQELARSAHAFRCKYDVDNILGRKQPNFAWFHSHLPMHLLAVTQQGYVVLLLKVAALCGLARPLRAAGFTADDLIRHVAFLWAYMFESLNTDDHPGSRLIMLADLKGLSVGQAIGGDGQAMGRAFGSVAATYPERMARTLIINAPTMFNLLWNMASSHLGESTRAKVQNLGPASSPAVTAELAKWLGQDMVPAEFGGPCKLPYDEYPVQKELLALVRQLNEP